MLVLATLCLLSNPLDCATVRIPLRDGHIEIGCMAMAQRFIADETSPGHLWEDYRAVKWGCARRGSKSAYAE